MPFSSFCAIALVLIVDLLLHSWWLWLGKKFMFPFIACVTVVKKWRISSRFPTCNFLHRARNLHTNVDSNWIFKSCKMAAHVPFEMSLMWVPCVLSGAEGNRCFAETMMIVGSTRVRCIRMHVTRAGWSSDEQEHAMSTDKNPPTGACRTRGSEPYTTCWCWLVANQLCLWSFCQVGCTLTHTWLMHRPSDPQRHHVGDTPLETKYSMWKGCGLQCP